MIEDKEIWRCAHHLMQRYGEAAGLHAAQRADELLERTDMEGHRVWLRILHRIEALGKVVPSGQLH